MPRKNLKVVAKKTHSVDGHAEMMGRPVYTDDYAVMDP